MSNILFLGDQKWGFSNREPLINNNKKKIEKYMLDVHAVWAPKSFQGWNNVISFPYLYNRLFQDDNYDEIIDTLLNNNLTKVKLN